MVTLAAWSADLCHQRICRANRLDTKQHAAQQNWRPLMRHPRCTATRGKCLTQEVIDMGELAGGDGLRGLGGRPRTLENSPSPAVGVLRLCSR